MYLTILFPLHIKAQITGVVDTQRDQYILTEVPYWLMFVYLIDTKQVIDIIDERGIINETMQYRGLEYLKMTQYHLDILRLTRMNG